MATLSWATMLVNRVLGDAVGYGAGSALGVAFAPPLRDLTYRLNRAYPNQVLTPETLADAVIRGVRDRDGAAGEAESWGVSGDRFDQLVRLAGNPPGPETLLDLWRRGAIAETDVDRGVRQGRIRTEWLEAIKALRQNLLTPAQVAGLVARGRLAQAEGEAEAARQGVSSERFGRLVEASAQAPTFGEAIELVNRGAWTLEQAERALRDAGVRPEYLTPLLTLREHLPSVSDEIHFAVREARSPEIRQRFGLDDDFPEEFARAAARRGLSRENSGNYWAAHWQLPSPEQAFRMLHRGEITLDELDLILRANDYMPYFRDKLRNIAFAVPGRIDTRRMYKAGVITREQVEANYRALGYEPANARILTEFAVSEKVEAERDLSKTEIVSLFEAESITRAQALDFLASLGYEAELGNFILDLAEVRKRRAFERAKTAVVKRRYLDRELTREEATTQLDSIGLPGEERDRWLDLWTFELEENPRRLTQAQAEKAWKATFITEDQYRDYLTLLGYPEFERDVLVAT